MSVSTFSNSIDSLVVSKHAKIRQQQRNISNDAVDLLLNYGVTKRQKGGCAVIYLNKQGKQVAMNNDIKPNISGVIDMTRNVLITVMCINKRIKNY